MCGVTCLLVFKIQTPFNDLFKGIEYKAGFSLIDMVDMSTPWLYTEEATKCFSFHCFVCIYIHLCCLFIIKTM